MNKIIFHFLLGLTFGVFISFCVLNINLIKEWQTLIGSFSGIVFAVIWYFIQERIKKENDRRETLRKIEVLTSIILNELAKRQDDWTSFILNLKRIASEEDAGRAGITLVNVPISCPLSSINEIKEQKVNSLILHNYLLNLDGWIKEMNPLFDEFRRNFFELQDETKKEFEKAQMNGGAHPKIVMTNYKGMLSQFAMSLEGSIYPSIKAGIEVVVVTKRVADIVLKDTKRPWWEFSGAEATELRRLEQTLNISDYEEFQNTVANHFHDDTFAGMNLYIEKLLQQYQGLTRSKALALFGIQTHN